MCVGCYFVFIIFVMLSMSLIVKSIKIMRFLDKEWLVQVLDWCDFEWNYFINSLIKSKMEKKNNWQKKKNVKNWMDDVLISKSNELINHICLLFVLIAWKIWAWKSSIKSEWRANDLFLDLWPLIFEIAMRSALFTIFPTKSKYSEYLIQVNR